MRVAIRWFLWQLLFALATDFVAHAQAFDFHYRPEWRRWNVWDYAATAALVGAYYGVEFGFDGPRGAEFREALPGLERGARDWLAADTRNAREQADVISDWLWRASVSYPVLDAAVTPLVRGVDVESSWRLSLINLQSFVVASLLLRIPHKFVGRERPLTLGCERDLEYSEMCTSKQRFVSFYGGHLTISMTGAGLACAHHLHGQLYAGGLPDVLACSASIGVATAVGYFRMRADKHWLTDQLLGAVVGFASGYLLPTLLYYRPWRRTHPPTDTSKRSLDGARAIVMPMLTHDGFGAGVLLVH